VQYNKAVVGRNAFAHESGIHQHGVLEDRETYEIIDAKAVGQEAAQIVLGKHSGRHAFADTLAKMGIQIHGDALNAAFARFKDLADKKAEIAEADLEAIVAEELGTSVVHRFALMSMDLHGGSSSRPTATLVLTDHGEKREVTADGNGMVDAACKAIAGAAGFHGRLVDYSVASITSGLDAQANVVVQLEEDGRRASGRGVSTDVVEASAKAYLAAVNRLLRLRDVADRDLDVGP
jgi:2-isopropylmalate synthase